MNTIDKGVFFSPRFFFYRPSRFRGQMGLCVCVCVGGIEQIKTDREKKKKKSNNG